MLLASLHANIIEKMIFMPGLDLRRGKIILVVWMCRVGCCRSAAQQAICSPWAVLRPKFLAASKAAAIPLHLGRRNNCLLYLSFKDLTRGLCLWFGFLQCVVLEAIFSKRVWTLGSNRTCCVSRDASWCWIEFVFALSHASRGNLVPFWFMKLFVEVSVLYFASPKSLLESIKVHSVVLPSRRCWS